MRVDGVSLDGPGPLWPDYSYEKKKANHSEKKEGMWDDKFKSENTQPAGTLFGVDTSKDIFSAPTPLPVELETSEPPGFLQMAYLQYPNEILRDKAFEIVSPSDSNDEKAEKLQKWVYDEIGYQLDIDQYGREELWVPPVMTFETGRGDCEDQAFLLHSLMLNAGIPAYRIRTYGGMVEDPAGGEGGHAWTAYLRESDNQWVILDSTYYPDNSPISARTLMKEDERYIDDLFFITLTETMTTPGTNRVRDPEILPTYTAMSVLQYNSSNMVGAWLNTFA